LWLEKRFVEGEEESHRLVTINLGRGGRGREGRVGTVMEENNWVDDGAVREKSSSTVRTPGNLYSPCIIG